MAFDSPEIRRFRTGKWRAWGCVPIGCSDKISPLSRTCRVNWAFSAGYTTSTPPPKTAIVPVPIDAACAAASTPRANPEQVTYPSSPKVEAKNRAIRVPREEALRAPTMPKTGLCSRSIFPAAQNNGGASTKSFRVVGYSGVPRKISFAPHWDPRLSSLIAKSFEQGA